jgi:plastocyanin
MTRRFARRPAISSTCLITAVAVILACGGSSSTAGPDGSENVVRMVSSGGAYDPVTYSFSPANLTISQGDTVIWVNATSAIHTVTADDGGFDSGDLGASATYERVFVEIGSHAYHCFYHAGQGMSGTITVNP